MLEVEPSGQRQHCRMTTRSGRNGNAAVARAALQACAG